MTQDYTALEAELRADELLYNRGLDYEALRIKPSAKNLAAADAIANLRRERDEARAETERQYEENVARIAEEGAAILRAEAAETECARLRARLWPNPNFGPQSTAEIAIFVEEERKEIAALRARLVAVEGALREIVSFEEKGASAHGKWGDAYRTARAALQEPQAARRKP